jgi:hypothetical protein
MEMSIIKNTTRKKKKITMRDGILCAGCSRPVSNNWHTDGQQHNLTTSAAVILQKKEERENDR